MDWARYEVEGGSREKEMDGGKWVGDIKSVNERVVEVGYVEGKYLLFD